MDTRSGRRIPATINATVRIDEKTSQGFHLAKKDSFEAQICDISTGGVGLIAVFALPKGLILDIQIPGTFFGSGKDVHLKGEVCYCKSYQVGNYKFGVKFIQIEKEYSDVMAHFISARERRSAPRLDISE